MEDKNLPLGWINCEIQDVAAIIGGGTPSTRDKENFSDKSGIPWITPADLSGYFKKSIGKGQRYLTVKGLDNSSAKVLPKGTVLFSTRAPIGYVAIAQNELATSQGFRSVLCGEHVLPEYMYYYLRTIKPLAEERASGTTFLEITGRNVGRLPIPIPPIDEQKRIIDSLDKVFRHIELAKERLENLPKLLKQFRETVVESASSGSLSYTWRQSNVSSDEDGELPSGWRLSTVSELVPPDGLFDGPFGSKLKTSDYTPSGVRVIRLENIGYLRFISHKKTYVSLEKYQTLLRHTVGEGDLIFSSFVVDSIRCCVLPTLSTAAIAKADCFTLRPMKELVDPSFLALQLSSTRSFTSLSKNVRGVTRPRINTSHLKDLNVLLAPMEEQREIVRQVDELLNVANDIEARFLKAKEHFDHIQDLLLAKAFSGALVSQDGLVYPNPELTQKVEDRQKKESEDSASQVPKTPVVGLEESAQPIPKDSFELQSRSDQHDILGMESTEISPNVMRLLKLSLTSPFKSLAPFEWEFASPYLFDSVSPKGDKDPQERGVEPICLIGTNGSGKSQLLELLAEIFCYLERSTTVINSVSVDRNEGAWQRSWEIEYRLPTRPSDTNMLQGTEVQILNPIRVKIIKTSRRQPMFFLLDEDGNSTPVLERKNQSLLLPVRVMGYSSGQNETLSPEFYLSRSLYARAVANQAFNRGDAVEGLIPFTRSMFVDYEENVSIALANFLLGKQEELKVFEEFTRIKGIKSFRLVISFSGLGQRPDIARTEELNSYVAMLDECFGGTKEGNENFPTWTFDVAEVNEKHLEKLRQRFNSPAGLFMALHKLRLLNELSIPDVERRRYYSGSRLQVLEKPPLPTSKALVFRLESLQLLIDDQPDSKNYEISYENLSDGEHQFLHIFGTILMTDTPGTLFLLDEPETHFNPEWRARFVSTLNRLVKERQQVFLLTTHSPFVVSDCQQENVYIFSRELQVRSQDDESEGASRPSVTFDRARFPTYGASFQTILLHTFGMSELIAEKSATELNNLINTGNLTSLLDAIGRFGESFEKSRLYEKIEKLRNNEKNLENEGLETSNPI